MSKDHVRVEIKEEPAVSDEGEVVRPKRLLLPSERAKRRLVQHPLATQRDFHYLRNQTVLWGTLSANRSIKEILDASFFIANKSAGPTSHQVAAYVKDILGIERTGHTGTLDPNVTGVLPVGLNRATKMIMGLLNTGKEYVCYLKLHDDYTPEQIQEVFDSFVGEIEQLPPVKSAIKRQLRTRTIYYLKILEFDGRDVLFRVGCEAGTYIRKLCTDIGEKLGSGGHMQQLVRTKAASFNVTHMHSLDELRDAFVTYTENGDEKPLRALMYSVEQAVSHLRKIFILPSASKALIHGYDLMVPGLIMVDEKIKHEEDIAIYDVRGFLVGLAKAKMTGKEMIRKRRGLCASPYRIFMRPQEVGDDGFEFVPAEEFKE